VQHFTLLVGLWGLQHRSALFNLCNISRYRWGSGVYNIDQHSSVCAIFHATGGALGFENLIYGVFEFIHALVDISKFKGLVKKSINDIIYYIILYTQITEDQVRSVSSVFIMVCLLFLYKKRKWYKSIKN